jgi:NAD(P)-dependent dehydrogenase (short-subunit alcohol dehydrogenase family)
VGWLDGKRALVTGAGSGIGAAIARLFAREGATVVVDDVTVERARTTVDSFEPTWPEGRALAADVSDPDAVRAMFAEIGDAYGRLDVLVNNAGIAGPTALVEDVAAEEWERCLAIGVTSHYRTCARVIPSMKAARAGSIINIASTAGQYGIGMRAPYVAAKWAVIGLTKTLAIELGPYDVRANAICPGSVDGIRMRDVIAREATARGASSEAVEREYLEGQSIARFVQPHEIADTCLFLASDAARMISGQAIAVDGHTETFHIG